MTNAAIIAALLERYYQDDTPEAGASSHWQHYARKFAVASEGGRVVSLKGAGFGNAHWRGWLHRAADTATIAAHIAQLPRKRELLAGYGRLRRVACAMGAAPTFDAFRQLCTLDLLEQRAAAFGTAPRIAIIGDGHGILSALVKDRWPSASITLIDLGRTLLFQAVNLQRAHSGAAHVLAGEGPLPDRADFTYCPADRLGALDGRRFDVAINIASMQEMTPATVTTYFAFLRRALEPRNLFYCCNRERKVLPGGEVSSFLDYPWSPSDRILIDEPCPWHQYYLAPSPTLFHRYDGVHRHRLTTLATESL